MLWTTTSRRERLVLAHPPSDSPSALPTPGLSQPSTTRITNSGSRRFPDDGGNSLLAGSLSPGEKLTARQWPWTTSTQRILTPHPPFPLDAMMQRQGEGEHLCVQAMKTQEAHRRQGDLHPTPPCPWPEASSPLPLRCCLLLCTTPPIATVNATSQLHVPGHDAPRATNADSPFPACNASHFGDTAAAAAHEELHFSAAAPRLTSSPATWFSLAALCVAAATIGLHLPA